MKIAIFSIVALGLCFYALGATTQTTPTNGVAVPVDLSQTLALEATRQELIEQRVDELVGMMAMLQRDLRSNGALGDSAAQHVAQLAGQLQALKTDHLAKAHDCLRAAFAKPADAARLVAVARQEIDLARRELGSLLLRAGMSQAAEVFADELHDLASRQEVMQQTALQAIAHSAATSPTTAPAYLAADQLALSPALARLLGEVASLPDTSTDALAAVRVSRTRKYLLGAKVVELLAAAADNLGQAKFAPAITVQGQALDILRGGEAKLRPDATLLLMVRTRETLQDMLSGVTTLRRAVETTADADWTAQSPMLARRQSDLAMPLATISASLQLEEFLKPAQAAAAEAAQALSSASRAPAIGAQNQLGDFLAKALEKLDQEITDFQRLDTSYRQLQLAGMRLRAVQDLRQRESQIIDDIDAAVAAKKPTTPQADAQERASAQFRRLLDALPQTKNDWSSALRVPMQKSAKLMNNVEGELRSGDATKAKATAFQSLDEMAEVISLMKKQMTFLEQVWTLAQLSADLKELSRYTGEVSAEQSDLHDQVQALHGAGKSVLDLTSPQDALLRATGELQESAALISEAHAMTDPLTDAKKAQGLAVTALGQDNAAGALTAQAGAQEKFAAAAKIAADLAARAEYLARWAEQLQQSAAKASDFLEQQIVLREQTEATEAAKISPIATDQQYLKEEVEVLTAAMPEAGGASFQKAADEMGGAITELKASHQAPAVAHQKKAEEFLRQGLTDMYKFAQTLKDAADATPNPNLPALLSVLSRLMIIAVEQSDLRDQTKQVAPSDIPSLASAQQDIMKETNEAADAAAYVPPGIGEDSIRQASTAMDSAAKAQTAAKRDAAVASQKLAEHYLRKAMAEIMVVAYEPPDPNPPPPDDTHQDDPNEPPPPPPPDPKGDWRVLLAGNGSGAAVAKDRSTWEALSQRDRAALNENFARELPLEYREILRDYYRTLSK